MGYENKKKQHTYSMCVVFSKKASFSQSIENSELGAKQVFLKRIKHGMIIA
ncbi:hypothetical protein [Clostridium saccharoperbutylacetonicum]